MKNQRLKEFEGYGYSRLGESIDGETIVAKRFDNGTMLIMAVTEEYIAQVRLTPEQYEALKAI